MLLCSKADLGLQDERGLTPLDCIRLISMQPGQQTQPGLALGGLAVGPGIGDQVRLGGVSKALSRSK